MTATVPPTFEHYETENPYTLLTQLHDLGIVADLDDPDQGLTVIAMAAAVVHWWERWQPTMVHRSLAAGATIDQVTAATGRNAAQLYHAWLRWSQGQVDLYEGSPETRPRPLGVSPEQFERIKGLLTEAVIGGGGVADAATR